MRLLLVSAVMLIVTVGSAAPILKEDPKEPYFPTKKGAKWVWVYKDDDHESIEVVTEVETKDKTTLVTVGHQSRNTVIPGVQIAVSEAGLAVRGGTGLDTPLEERLCLLKLPHKDGNKWKRPFPPTRCIGRGR